MQSTTEPTLIRRYQRHRRNHPNAPGPTDLTIGLTRETLRRNGPMDYQYIHSFEVWARKMSGEHDLVNAHTRNRTEHFLLPELKALLELIRSISEAYRRYEVQEKHENMTTSRLEAAEENSSHSQLTASAATNASDNDNTQEIGFKVPSSPTNTTRNNDQISNDDKDSDEKAVTDNAHSPTTHLGTSARTQSSPIPSSTLNPSPAAPSPRSVPYRFLPSFHPSQHPYDGPVFLNALCLVTEAVRRLESLLEEIDAHFALAEDMGEIWQYWADRVEDWAERREMREKKWGEKGRQRNGTVGKSGKWDRDY